MDNLTHSLTGLAMARAGLDRLSPRATALLILSANLPDVDAVGLLHSPLQYLKFHRGYTHSILGLPIISLLAVLIVAALFRQTLPWGKAWMLCAIGVASHLLIDWTNDYGIRLLLPFSSKWFALDINSLYDGAIMAALVFAALWPYLEGLVNGEIGDKRPAGRGTAVFALLFFVSYDGGRALMHNRAVNQLQSVLYDGESPLQAAALPNPFNPFRWKGVVETSRSYRLVPVDAVGQLEPENALLFYKPSFRKTLESAKRTEPFRYFLYFARFPVWSEDKTLNGEERTVRIELSDLRFGLPGAGLFHCEAIEDGQGHLLKSEFKF
ncbi:MAG TPA: metal-dependent hydrolase [Bryobacteraceae bacterium]